MSENASRTKLTIASSAFESKGDVPLKYAYKAAGGENSSVPVSWSGVPAGTVSLALLVYDIHPVAHDWVHWMVTGISPETAGIAQGVSGTDGMPAGSREWKNSYGEVGYGGPCPPVGSGSHEYKFIVYALNTDKVEIPQPVSYKGIVRALEGKILEQAELQGFYERK